jgi:hypothetical protein
MIEIELGNVPVWSVDGYAGGSSWKVYCDGKLIADFDTRTEAVTFLADVLEGE